VELREESLHLLARHILSELTEVVYLEGNHVTIRRSGVRAEQAVHPVIPPVSYRAELTDCRRVGLEDPAFVVLRVDALFEVDQHDHGRHIGSSLGAGLHDDLVYVAPDPILPRLEGLDERVLRGVEVLGSVLVLGVVAAADVAAGQALAQVNPAVSHLEALLASLG
jgi:hypothetical protein